MDTESGDYSMRDLDRILFSVSPNVRQNNGLSRHHLTRYKYVNTGVSNVITSIKYWWSWWHDGSPVHWYTEQYTGGTCLTTEHNWKNDSCRDLKKAQIKLKFWLKFNANNLKNWQVYLKAFHWRPVFLLLDLKKLKFIHRSLLLRIIRFHVPLYLLRFNCSFVLYFVFSEISIWFGQSANLYSMWFQNNETMSIKISEIWNAQLQSGTIFSCIQFAYKYFMNLLVLTNF